VTLTLTGQRADAVRKIAQDTSGLQLLALHGSRSRADARPDSDWDFGYLCDDGCDPDQLRAHLVEALDCDRVDLADLARASGQLRFRVARDGHVVFSRHEGTWDRFWMDAVSFWCDAGPVLREAYDGVLQELRR
jgi:predicted nucleotidyltransferase